MNLLVTGAWNGAEKYISKIQKQGHKVEFMQYEKEEIPCSYEWVEGIICNGLFLYHKIEKFSNLEYIQLTSAGFERVPMDYVKKQNIRIYNARGVYSIPMAEFAMAGVLQLYKRMDFFRENQKKREWNKQRGLLELYGKTVCIIGCGSIGTECAKRFQVFGCRVIGVDLYPREDNNYEEIKHLKYLDDVLSQADILVMTVPLTQETVHLMNKERLGALKPGAIFVNIARGAIIDMDALYESIDKLGGAVLDVFEEEPLSKDNLLWDRERVIVTPHNSYVGDGNEKRLSELILSNLGVECE